MEHEDLYTFRHLSILPPQIQTTVFALGQAIKNRSIYPSQISEFRESLKSLNAADVPRATREICEIAQLWHDDHSLSSFSPLSWFKRSREQQVSLSSLLSIYNDLGWLLMFHANGFVRQEALEKLATSPNSDFEFAAIVYRMNDWVENIRVAATRYAEIFFPKINPEIVARSSFFLLAQALVLNRWNKEGQAILENAIYRPDVLENIKKHFMDTRSGRVGYTLRQITKRPDFDSQLEGLAHNAALPCVRAIAMETLLNQKARWFIGYTKQWVDKVYNISKRLAVFETRKTNIDCDFEALLLAAAADKSAQVRKVAANVLLENRHKASQFMDEVAQSLQNDKNNSVRSRIDCFLRKRAEEGH